MGCGSSVPDPVNLPPKTRKDESIAIVGAGPTGLLAATWLKRRGYTNVQLFEPQKEVGGLCYTIEVDGRHFDFATKYFPSTTVNGFGALPDFQELIARYNLEILATPPPAFYNTAQQKLMASPPLFDDVPVLDYLQFFKGFDLCRTFSQHVGVKNALDAGVCKPGELATTWAKDNDMEVFISFALYLADVYGAGPAARQTLAFLMSYREHYITTYIYSAIKKILKRAEEAGDVAEAVAKLYTFINADPQLKTFLEQDSIPPHFVFKNGYQEFLNSMVTYEKLAVNLNEGVTNLQRDDKGGGGGGWAVSTSQGRTLAFDAVIVTTLPSAYAGFLASSHPIVALMDQCEQGPGIEVWGFHIEQWTDDDTKRFGDDRGGWVFSEPSAGFGTGNVEHKGRPYAFSKEYSDSNFIVAIAYIDHDLPSGPEGRKVKEPLMRKNFEEFSQLKITEVTFYQSFASWPPQVGPEAEANGWHGDVDKLQGKDKLYFAGEAMFAIGVQSCVDGISEFMPKYFEDSEEVT